jgi:hypothetical protein
LLTDVRWFARHPKAWRGSRGGESFSRYSGRDEPEQSIPGILFPILQYFISRRSLLRGSRLDARQRRNLTATAGAPHLDELEPVFERNWTRHGTARGAPGTKMLLAAVEN